MPAFLESIDDARLGGREPAEVFEHRRIMALSVVSSIVHGDQNELDYHDMLVCELGATVVRLCGNPLDPAAIQAFAAARERFREIH